MFVREETFLSAPVTLVQQHILDQVDDDGLHAAAIAALDNGQRTLTDEGHAAGFEPVTVRTLEAYLRGDVAVIPIRCYTLAAPSGHEPTLDANLELDATTPTTTRLVITGIYRPPLPFGTEPVESSVQQRAGRSTAKAFLAHIADLMPTPSSGIRP